MHSKVHRKLIPSGSTPPPCFVCVTLPRTFLHVCVAVVYFSLPPCYFSCDKVTFELVSARGHMFSLGVSAFTFNSLSRRREGFKNPSAGRHRGNWIIVCCSWLRWCCILNAAHKHRLLLAGCWGTVIDLWGLGRLDKYVVKMFPMYSKIKVGEQQNKNLYREQLSLTFKLVKSGF